MNEELRVLITAEIDGLKREVNKAKQEIDGFSRDSQSSLNKFANAAKTTGKAIGNAFKTIATAAIAVGAAVFGLSESTKEFRTNQAKLQTSFEAAGASAEVAKETYNDLYRVLGDDNTATEAANHLAQLTTNQEELSQWTNICQGVYATFGDSLPVESLTEAVNHSAKLGEVQGTLADALEWSGVNMDDFNEQLFWCNSESEREKLIRDTLNGLYSEAAAGYEENASAVLAENEAQLALKETLAEAGEVLGSVTNLIKIGLAGALKAVLPYIETMSSGFVDMMNGVDGGAEKIAEGFGGMLDKVGDFITNNLDGFVKIGTTILETLVNTINEVLPKLVEAFAPILPELLKTIITSMLSTITSLVENTDEILVPILKAIPSIFGAIIDAILKFLPNFVEAIANLISGIIDNLPGIIKVFVAAIPVIYEKIILGLISALPYLIAGLIEIINAIVLNLPKIIMAIIQALPSILIQIGTTLIKSVPLLLTSINTMMGTVKTSALKLTGNLALDAVKTLFNGFKEVPNRMKLLFNMAVEGIKAAFSPITIFFSNILTKIKSIFNILPDWFKNKFTEAWQNVKNVFSAGGQVFNGIKDGILSGLKTVVNGLITGINKVIAVPFNGLNTALSRIRGISIAGIKPFDWISTISVPQIPKLYKGGVLEKGQVGLLEGNGAEAVVPLENNLEWLNKLAGMLSDRLTPGAPIVLTVDGKVFAQTAVSTINNMTRQQGKLALNIL